MAGVRAFDTQQVLDDAVKAFWEHGYRALSLSGIEAATGLQRSSLYNAFGSKRELFIAVLRRYWDWLKQERAPAFGAANPVRGMALLFEELLGRMANPELPRGCLLANTCIEVPSIEESIGRVAAAQLAELEAAIHGLLTRARDAGQLAAATDLRATARFYVAVLRGMAVMHRVSGDTAAARDVAKVALSVIGGALGGAQQPAAQGSKPVSAKRTGKI